MRRRHSLSLIANGYIGVYKSSNSLTRHQEFMSITQQLKRQKLGGLWFETRQGKKLEKIPSQPIR
jgi:hypothetical protein